MSENPV